MAWWKTAYVGQKVTLVSDTNKWKSTIGEHHTRPEYGLVYTIREVRLFEFCYSGVGIDIGLRSKIGIDGIEWYDAKAFKPVQTRDTAAEVEKLKRLLDRAPADLESAE